VRNAMDAGRQTARFLTALLFVLATPAIGQVVVTAKNGPCAQTTFEVALLSSKIQPPPRVKLEITQRTTKIKTVRMAALDDAGRYHTAPLQLPFADYDISVFSDTASQMLLGEYHLGTAELPRVMIPGADKHPLHVRGDYTIHDREGAKQPLLIAVNPSRDASLIHIIVIDENLLLVSQYLGSPLQRWASDPLQPGRYDVWMMESRPGSCAWVQR
jgi:hypothetical protein